MCTRVDFPARVQVSGGTKMQIQQHQSTAVKTPYQTPKLELHGVWKLATGVALSIIGGNLVPPELEVEL